MKKKLIVIVSVVFAISLSLYFAFKHGNTIINNITNGEDKIQLWYYYIGREKGLNSELIDGVKNFCEENDIPLEIHEYGSDIITYKDYVLKRNIAAATGNFISIDMLSRLNNMPKNSAADYTKLESYNKLFEVHKGKSCVPLGMCYVGLAINKKAIDYYGIDTFETPVITYTEYLKIKQEMKEKGARFKINDTECREIVDYCLNKNGVLFLNENSDYVKDSGEFKARLKKSIMDICNDIILYHDSKLYNYDPEGFYNNLPHLYDENSSLDFIGEIETSQLLISPLAVERISNISDKTLMIYPYAINYSPAFFMNKKITNNKIYDIANYVVNESRYLELIGYGIASDMIYTPIFDTEEIRKALKVDENWEYTGRIGRTINSGGNIKRIINASYNIFIKDKEKADEVARYSYDPIQSSTYDVYIISAKVVEFTESLVFEIAKELSGEKNSLDNFDSENSEINKMIDDKINQFVDSYYLYN